MTTLIGKINRQNRRTCKQTSYRDAMNHKEIATKLRIILNSEDIESEGIVNRKKSHQHSDDIQILLEHISIMVIDLKFDAEASRRELFETRALLEQ